jgi:LPS-assembly protein
MRARERYFEPEQQSLQAEAAAQESFAILEVPLAMRARTFWCTTLLLLCHPQLWSQALTKQFPLAGPAAAQNAAQAETQAPAPSQKSANLPDDASAQSTIPEAHVVPAPPVGVPVKIEADSQSYVKTDAAGFYTLTGHVVIHYKDYVVSADHATFNQDTGDIVADGNLHLDGGPDKAHLIATHGTMNLNAHTGHFYDVTGTLGEGRAPEIKTVTKFLPGQGAMAQNKMVLTSSSPFAVTGRELIQTGEQMYHVVDGTMTSCMLPNPDWQLVAHNFFLEKGVARGKNSLFELDGLPVVHKVPVFYMPYVTHAINSDSRQSGFMIPIFGNDTTKGLIFGEQVYIVLGRSADLTVGSEYFSNRGFAPNAMFRYRGRDNDFANFRFNSLLDRLPGTENQGGVDLIFDGRHDFDSETRTAADIEYLSSYTYRQEFEDNYAIAINSEVKSQAFLSHAHNGLAEGVSFNRYESFESSAGSSTGEEEIKIFHTPTFQFDGIDQYLEGTPLMWGVNATASGLSRSEPGFQTSKIIPRLDVYPHLALPVHFDGWTLRPVVGVRDTFYSKSQNPGPLGEVPTERDATLNRKDFEASMDFRPPALERDFSAPWLEHLLGGEIRHTLEPDVQYKYVTGIENFDSVLRFDTVDLASNTNELDYGLTQRLFLRHLSPHPCTGDEALGPDAMCGGETVNWLSWQVEQKYFFDDHFGGAITPRTRNVLDTTLDLTGVAFLNRPRAYSPVISRLRLQTTSATNLEWDVDYDTKTGRLDSSNLFTTYKHGDFSFTLGDAHLHTLAGAAPGTPAPSTGTTTATTPPETDFNQLRLTAIYGSPIKSGLSAGLNTGYDFTLDRLQYAGIQANYNWNCCGLSFEVRRYSLGTVPEHTTFLYSFTLANVGSAGSLSWAERVF